MPVTRDGTPSDLHARRHGREADDELRKMPGREGIPSSDWPVV